MLGTICLKARILSREGLKLGKVKGLVANSDTGRLTHLVVETNLFDYYKKVVPAEDIKELAAEGAQLQLGLGTAEFLKLPDYIECDYCGTGTDYPDAPYTMLASGSFSPCLFNRSYYAPLPEALTTSEGGMLIKETCRKKVNLPANSLQLRDSALVVEQGGRKIGHLKKVTLELYTGKILKLGLSRGFLFEQEKILDFQSVTLITEYAIKVKVRDFDPVKVGANPRQGVL